MKKCGAGGPPAKRQFPVFDNSSDWLIVESKSISAIVLNHFYRRRLPHLRNGQSIYFVTWRISATQSSLSNQERELVHCCLMHFNNQRYQIYASVVMNDHVHAVFSVLGSMRVDQIVHTWKSFTSHRIIEQGNRSSPLWQDESFDRIIRNEGELAEKIYYVHENAFKRWAELASYQWLYLDNSILGD